MLKLSKGVQNLIYVDKFLNFQIYLSGLFSNVLILINLSSFKHSLKVQKPRHDFRMMTLTVILLLLVIVNQLVRKMPHWKEHCP